MYKGSLTSTIEVTANALLSMEPWGLRPKKFQTSVAVPPAPVWVPSQRALALSVASVANDPGGCAQISWHLPYS
jgi:hypothetical protein